MIYLLYTVTIASGARSLIVIYGFAWLRFLVTAIKWTLQVIMLIHDVGFFQDTIGGSRYTKTKIFLHLNGIKNLVVATVAIELTLLVDEVSDIIGCI